MTDTDIVTRLRAGRVSHHQVSGDDEPYETVACRHSPPPIQVEAADELERLADQLVEVGKVAIDRGNQLIAANAEIERLRAALSRLLDCSQPNQEHYNEEAHDIADNKARALLGAKFKA